MVLSASLIPTPALGSLSFQLEFYSWRDPELSTAPHPVHLMGEMSSELG